MDHLGAAIGPVLATLFLLAWPGQLRLLFLLTLIPGLIVVGLVSLGVRENRSKVRFVERPQLSRMPLGRGFRFYLFTVVLYTLGNSSDAFLLVRASEVGVPAALLPILWSAFHIVKSSANLLAGKLADRFGPRVMVVTGWAIYAVIYFAFAAAYTAWQVWIIFLSYGFVFSLSEPAQKSLVARLAPGGQRGLAFGWFHLAVGVAALPSSLICGWLYERFGAFTAFGWGAALAAIAALLLLCLPRNLEPQLADTT
jgi:MFS family permease